MSAALERALLGALTERVAFAHAPIDASADFEHVTESAAVERAVDGRRREFATGRRLAHACLRELGLDDGPLLVGPDRGPTWPAGATGSISHGAGRCVVTVARTTDVEALGVDVEEGGPLEARLIDAVLTANERARLAAGGADVATLAKQVFCAKEAFYKAVAPRVGRVLEFGEVEVELDGSRFVASCCAEDVAALRCTGRLHVDAETDGIPRIFAAVVRAATGRD